MNFRGPLGSALAGEPLGGHWQTRTPPSCHPRSAPGGADRDRTDDPLLAKQVLSQLSYSPMMSHTVVGLGRLELPTSRLSGVRSNQLSYRPRSVEPRMKFMAGPRGRHADSLEAK